MTEKASVPSGRSVAAHVLMRVLDDGAYAAAAIDAELKRHPQLDTRERGLATELVYGVLRTRPALERRLRRFTPRPVRDRVTEVQLLVAAYQILVLTRVPAFAAVNAAVEAVRSQRGARLGGFVNAVLRKLSASGEALSLTDAVRQSAPAWLVERLQRKLTEAETLALLGAGDSWTASASVRLRPDRAAPEWLAEAPPGRVSPIARRVERAGDLRKLPGYSEGSFVIQEEGSQVVALLLGARPGERVLDACAGRGQKASLLADQIGTASDVWAADAYPAKLEQLGREFERLGLGEPPRRAVDWTQGVGSVPDGFDRVLVDAPCTGTGTLRHRPEILLRLGPDDPARLAELARTILLAAASRAKPGGRVVFAVCSVLEEENEAVVDSVLDALEPVPFDAPALAGKLPDGATQLRLLPGEHGTDGYFIASFVRRA